VRASRNSIFVQQCRLVLPSPLALPFFIALASLRAVASLLALASLLVSADLLQGSHSQAETHKFNLEFFKSFVMKGLLRDYFTLQQEVLLEYFMQERRQIWTNNASGCCFVILTRG